MKRAILIGMLCFTAGAVTSPRAANKNEALDVLCARFKTHVQKQHDFATERLAENPKWGLDKAQAMAEERSLSALKIVVCGDGK